MVVGGVLALTLIALPERAHADDTRKAPEMVRYDDGIFAVGFTIGVASSIVSGIALIAGMSTWNCFGADSPKMNCTSGDISAANTAGAVVLAGLGTALFIGLPLALWGMHEVPRVTAGVGPTGGALRVTF